ncbi:unnamed protein product [Cercopithifilaria johnstoni]|uniref:Uncharacterized protein n=1 Tax=Cercopithifilaria johnstoni TaxID=2874296 RepID=A0A8J2Q1H4_9BILA|nr:unnamed protein product [Cercopithifilaria johnstoni]
MVDDDDDNDEDDDSDDDDGDGDDDDDGSAIAAAAIFAILLAGDILIHSTDTVKLPKSSIKLRNVFFAYITAILHKSGDTEGEAFA